MEPWEVEAKLKASQAPCGVYDPSQCNKSSPEPPTLRREAEERVGTHRREAEKADQAAAFFRDNPAFDLFVRLVRQGVIQFY